MENQSTPIAIILMGVSGSGKTAVGERLSAELGWPFFDGDDFHPPKNIQKMARGIPLSDQDRYPWLDRLNEHIHDHLNRNISIIIACSALKRSYRKRLSCGNRNMIFVYLKGDFDLIFSRMKNRTGHYMKENMLRSQFVDMEEPRNAMLIYIDKDISCIVDEIIRKFYRKGILNA